MLSLFNFSWKIIKCPWIACFFKIKAELLFTLNYYVKRNHPAPFLPHPSESMTYIYYNKKLVFKIKTIFQLLSSSICMFSISFSFKIWKKRKTNHWPWYTWGLSAVKATKICFAKYMYINWIISLSLPKFVILNVCQSIITNFDEFVNLNHITKKYDLLFLFVYADSVFFCF